ncbi:MAG: hypothetical protein KJO96_07450 [Winogradskyella sp.]|nr:hypothetical protein [Winogradskyella sp.]
MKFLMKPTLLLTFFALFLFTSCQDEVVDIIDPNEQETIVPGSRLANLMRSATSNDGSYDNILDNSDCFSIELPVTIILDGITITIEEADDLDELEDLLEELVDNEDFIDFVFPLTIILNDYTEIVIESLDQLEAYIDQCDNDEDVIECVDFQYPISFSVFNTEFQVIDTIVIESDQQLYAFLESLDDENAALLISLNFPVTLVYANGDTLVVNNNQELSDAIEAAEEDCDDDDPTLCDEDEIAQNLLECRWEIDDTNFNDFDDLHITFNANGGFVIEGAPGTANVTGNWDLETTDIGVKLILSELTAFQEDLGGIWLIVECEEDELEIIKGDLELELDRDCETDFNCEVQDLAEDLIECYWIGVSNLFENITPQPFYFTANGEVYLGNANGSDETPTGTYDIAVTGSSIYLILDLGVPYEFLSGEWQLVECDDDRYEFINGDNYLVFEQECENLSDVFECFSDFVITACDENNDIDDGKAIFNISANTIGTVDCIAPYTASFHETEADAEANLNAIVNTEEVLSASTVLYLRIEASNSEFEIYEVVLVVEDCEPNGCSELDVDNILMECSWFVTNYNGSDDLSIYQLDFNMDQELIITNTTDNSTITAGWSTFGGPDGVVVEFSNVNGSNIQAISGNWTVVECSGEILVFTRENDQMVLERDCNTNNFCNEQDVLANLLECVWVPVNYNGDDVFVNYVMQFNSDQSLIVEGNGMNFTGNYSIQQGSALFLFIGGLDNTEVQDLGADWTVVECNSNRLELVSNNNILVLERECN